MVKIMVVPAQDRNKSSFKRNFQVNSLLNMEPKVFNQVLDIWKEQHPVASQENELYFFGPGFINYHTNLYSSQKSHFPAASTTGSSCALNCAHCGKTKLRTMLPARTPSELLALAKELVNIGSEGLLLSGGCTPDGTVDFRKLISTIKEIKQKYDLKVHVHTGLITREMAQLLGEANVDAALIDIIGSKETIRQVYGLDASPLDYLSSLQLLQEQSIPTVPHIIVGLHHGKLLGEFKALEIVSKCSISALVIVVFTPLPGTLFANVSPPDSLSVAKVIMGAKILSISPIVLGCAKPFGAIKREIEKFAIDLGVNGIAFPTQKTIDYSKKIGKSSSFHKICCSEIYHFIQHRKEKEI